MADYDHSSDPTSGINGAPPETPFKFFTDKVNKNEATAQKDSSDWLQNCTIINARRHDLKHLKYPLLLDMSTSTKLRWRHHQNHRRAQLCPVGAIGTSWNRLEAAVPDLSPQRPLSPTASPGQPIHMGGDNHLPGQPLPMLDHSLSKEFFPNIQSKPPLLQLEAISSCPITSYLEEEIDTHLTTTSFQVAVESDKVSPQPPFLQAEQSQFLQPLLIRLLLQTLHQLRCPSLDTLQQQNVLLVPRGPKLNTVFEVQPHQCPVQGHDHFPNSCWQHYSDTSQDAISLLGHLGTLLAVNQHPQVLFCQAAFQPLFPKTVPLHGDGDSTTSLGSMFQCLTTLSVKFFLIPNLNVSRRNLRPFPLVLSLVTWKKRPTPTSLQPPFRQSAIKVSPQPPLLQAKQPQLPQPLLIRLQLQTLHQLRCPSLHTLQHLNVFLVVGGPKLNTVFEVQPHQCRVQGHDHFPSPAGHTIPDTSQDAVSFLGHLGTLLAHIQPAVNQHPQVLFHWAAFQPLFPKPVALHGVVVTKVQDQTLGLVKPHTIDLGPSIQPVQVPLQSLPTLKQIDTPTQFGVICKLTEGALNPLIQIMD
ncbi:hypothetical protein QYF61_007207 [Mycteria americana]|uniref:Uncharacterized protein n=1 Tax=Mycteria americana TaxID=33587 RepID=A0AAN7N330_MYCAM|nr:hypothetical protein QYF61_007207 [Mycteria americana]